MLRIAAYLIVIAILVLFVGVFSFGGPFRPPSFDKFVTPSKTDGFCLTQLHGSWPNLPHDPAQWFWGGRSELTFQVYTQSTHGRYDASQLDLYILWTHSKQRISIKYSGYVEFKGAEFIVNLYDDEPPADGTKGHTPFHENGSYTITNPSGCS
jgi:hypothetical protein